jgi:hypothetical protein
VDPRDLPGRGRGWQTARGSLGLWLPGRDLLIAQLQGHGEDEFSWPVVEAFDSVLAANRSVRLYFDVAKLHNYDSPLRTRLTARFVRDRKAIATLDILVQSKIVAMGVSVANLALGGLIKSHTTRGTFNAALDEAVRAADVAGFSSNVLVSA